MELTLPRWIAHRGGGTLAPENTLGGLRLAARLGFRAVEFDVMLSGSGTPCLIHDETLERTTNGHGRVCDTPDAVLLALNAGEGEHIPTLRQAAALCIEYGLLANVELKPAAGFDEATAEVAMEQIVACWCDAPVPPLISSFSRPCLEIAKARAPALLRGLLMDPVLPDWADEARRLQVSSIHCSAQAVTSSLVAEAQAMGLPVLCYTVNDPDAAAALFALGVHSLFTDRLDRFARETSAYKGLHFEG